MKDFDYVAATSVAQAVGLLAERGDKARILAGGTDILVQLREGLRDADLVVDIKKIPELLTFSFDPAGGLLLGAAVPAYQLYGDGKISAAYSALADAARIIGGWQIQSRASIGGNLCNSSPAADSTPALIALDAVCRLVGPQGKRTVPVAEFCTAPGRNVLQPGEFVTALALPAPRPNSGSAYLRFIPRNEMDIAVVGAGAWLQLNSAGTNIEQARIALGAVAPTPLFAKEASQWLVGQPANAATFAAAGDRCRALARPISDMRGPAEYRTHLVGVLVARALQTAADHAQGKQTNGSTNGHAH